MIALPTRHIVEHNLENSEPICYIFRNNKITMRTLETANEDAGNCFTLRFLVILYGINA